MNAASEVAIRELVDQFPDAEVQMVEDAGGVWVTLAPVDLGPNWKPRSTWLGFHIPNTYPYADVYPHFVGADVVRSDTNGHIEAVSPNASCNGTPAVQLSRRSNRWSPTADTAALKARRIIDWMRAQ